MKKIFSTLLLIVIGIYSYLQNNPQSPTSSTDTTAPRDKNITISNNDIAIAFQNRTSDIQVHGSGKVKRVLSDDNEGSRHQRFILRLSGDLSVLIAHNIDLAPRVRSLHEGDRVEFSGEYEWNSQGGVIHWTHRDKAHRHLDGWLKHHGRKYD